MPNFYFPEKDKKHLTEDESSQLGNAHAEMVEGLISKSLIAIGGKLQSDEEIFRHLRKPGFKSYKKWLLEGSMEELDQKLHTYHWWWDNIENKIDQGAGNVEDNLINEFKKSENKNIMGE